VVGRVRGRGICATGPAEELITAMTDDRIRRLETDFRALVSLVAQLETKAQGQKNEIEHLHQATAALRRRLERLERQSPAAAA
jgi:hypothetical protein